MKESGKHFGEWLGQYATPPISVTNLRFSQSSTDNPFCKNLLTNSSSSTINTRQTWNTGCKITQGFSTFTNRHLDCCFRFYWFWRGHFPYTAIRKNMPTAISLALSLHIPDYFTVRNGITVVIFRWVWFNLCYPMSSLILHLLRFAL